MGTSDNVNGRDPETRFRYRRNLPFKVSEINYPSISPMSGGRGGLTYNKRLGTEDFHRHGFCMDKEDLGLAVRIKTTRLTSTEEDLDHQVSRYLSF